MHQHSDEQRSDTSDSKKVDGSADGLIQSRSIDHLLCGDDGKCLKLSVIVTKCSPANIM